MSRVGVTSWRRPAFGRVPRSLPTELDVLMGKLRTANNRAKRIRARVIAALAVKPAPGAPVKRVKGAAKAASA